MAKAKQKDQLPARRGRGRPTKYDPRYIPIVRELVLRGLIDVEIAEMLQIDESTLYDWKLRHADFSQAMKRSKELVCDRLEATMVMRANGFERKVEKATASGRKVVINEYFPPETAAGKFLLQHRRPEVFRERRAGLPDVPAKARRQGEGRARERRSATAAGASGEERKR